MGIYKGRFLRVLAAIFAVTVVSNLFLVPPAVAQEEGSKQEIAQEENARGEYELGTMAVTAQKQEENVQEVPISISVFNELDIEDRKIESVNDLADFVPNLMLNQENMPTMRGITASIMALNVSTGLFVDGVPILMATGFDDTMLDIERIEVLRGPQGTLYGKGAEVGAISIITRQPDNEFRGKVSAEGGELLSAETGDKRKGAFTLNMSGPILKDKLFFGIAGKYEQKDGFIENTTIGGTLNDREHWFGRAHLRWAPIDKLDISLIASHLEHDDGGLSMGLYNDPMQQDRQVSSNINGNYVGKSDTQILKIAYEINESLTLTSVSSNWLYKDILLMDWDFSPLTIYHEDKNNEFSKISQEFLFNYSAESLKWLVGFYYDKIHNDIESESLSMYPSYAGVSDQDIYGDTYAVFANLTYPLTKQFSLITGLRYEKEEHDFENNTIHYKDSDSWSAFTPKIALEYRFSPEIMTYVSASKGYRAGGYNIIASDPQYYSFDQEELWSYEIGVKSMFMNNRLIVNGSVYYMDITEMQVMETISAMESLTTNAAEATGKGFELEMTARVSDGLSFMAGFGYSDIEFDKFSDLLGNYEGNENPLAPKYTFSVGGQYRHSSGFYARADLIGYGKMYLDKANKYSRDAYEIVNAKIGYERERFDVYLYGKNIFDKEYNTEGVMGSYTYYSDPGEVGLQLVYRF